MSIRGYGSANHHNLNLAYIVDMQKEARSYFDMNKMVPIQKQRIQECIFNQKNSFRQKDSNLFDFWTTQRKIAEQALNKTRQEQNMAYQKVEKWLSQR